jgi:hypothetical protein
MPEVSAARSRRRPGLVEYWADDGAREPGAAWTRVSPQTVSKLLRWPTGPRRETLKEAGTVSWTGCFITHSRALQLRFDTETAWSVACKEPEKLHEGPLLSLLGAERWLPRKEPCVLSDPYELP